jgi:hypothetical protein
MAVARDRGRLCAPLVHSGNKAAVERLHARNCGATRHAELLSALTLRITSRRLVSQVEPPVAVGGRIGGRFVYGGQAITGASLAAVTPDGNSSVRSPKSAWTQRGWR